jgi:nucleotide-binding universal stress UspA family protein
MRIRRILVALDGTRDAEVALLKVIELAKQNARAKIVLVRAVDPATLAGNADTDTRAAAINEAAEYLSNVAARLRSEGIRPVTRCVWFAGPGHAISEVSRTERPDLIVMVSRLRNGAGRLVPGPIAEFVRDRTETPIVLVRAGDTPAATRRGDVTETALVHASASAHAA